MTDYIVEALPTLANTPTEFKVQYTKVVRDIKGNDVVVIDEENTEQVTIEQLQAQKLNLQESIKRIDAKIEAITKL